MGELMGKLVWTCLDGAAPKVLWVHNGGTEEIGIAGGAHWSGWIGRRKAVRNLQKHRKMLFALWLGDFKPGCWVINGFGMWNVSSEGLACVCAVFEWHWGGKALCSAQNLTHTFCLPAPSAASGAHWCGAQSSWQNSGKYTSKEF